MVSAGRLSTLLRLKLGNQQTEEKRPAAKWNASRLVRVEKSDSLGFYSLALSQASVIHLWWMCLRLYSSQIRLQQDCSRFAGRPRWPNLNHCAGTAALRKLIRRPALSADRSLMSRERVRIHKNMVVAK